MDTLAAKGREALPAEEPEAMGTTLETPDTPDTPEAALAPQAPAPLAEPPQATPQAKPPERTAAERNDYRQAMHQWLAKPSKKDLTAA
jgi:hypothetical protein